MRKNKANLIKLASAGLIVIIFGLFMNDGFYNSWRALFVENSKLYTEITAYGKAKTGISQRYFVIQNRPEVGTLVDSQWKLINEAELSEIPCSEGETMIAYEEPSPAIETISRQHQGEDLVLNQGTELEFFITKIKGRESCQIKS